MSKHNELGVKGEVIALEFLEKKGYDILEINWRFAKTEVDIIARDLNTLVIVEVKTRTSEAFGLPEDAQVVCCYEAGRDGFWLHRFLLDQGVQNQVVDSSSIEVNRRRRWAKSDNLDTVKLVEILIRWHNGERKVWSTVYVPTVVRMG